MSFLSHNQQRQSTDGETNGRFNKTESSKTSADTTYFICVTCYTIAMRYGRLSFDVFLCVLWVWQTTVE